jgi:flavin reductase (DIM6/NTAB) family NADH-FMN oxidoreductase RutF
VRHSIRVFATLPEIQRYKLLCGLVTPRPIALVTTLAPNGVVNAAPFSFFNVVSEDPPLIVVCTENLIQ